MNNTQIITYIMFFLFAPLAMALGSGDSLMGRTKEVLECYEGTTTAGSVNCMLSLSKIKEEEYKKSYNDFMKITKEKDLSYGKEFIQYMNAAKKDFDNYMNNICNAYSSPFDKDGYGYHIIHSRCMVTLYDQRIKFYKEYQF